MKTVIKNAINIVAAIIFVAALALNVGQSNDESFFQVGEQALATATVSCRDVEFTGGAFRYRLCATCCWEDINGGTTGTCNIPDTCN